MPLDPFRPRQEELRKLALAETDPSQHARFEPICKGPVFAVLVLIYAGVIALPFLVVRAVRHVLGLSPGDSL
jgi:hypothetical protein